MNLFALGPASNSPNCPSQEMNPRPIHQKGMIILSGRHTKKLNFGNLHF